VREARASRGIVAADLWPQVEATGSYIRERTSKNGISTGAPGKVFNLFQAGFDANWEVDVFGGNRRAVEAADASVEAAEDDRDAVLVSLMGEVGLEYVTYRSLQQRIALANRNLAAQQGTLDLTRRLFSAGLAPELDVQRAAAQVATTASTIPLLVQQAAQAMHALSVLIGEPPMTLQDELAAVGPIPKPPAQVAVGLPSELLLRRPDVARSERQLAAQTAQIGVATRDLYPRFFISGVANLQSVKASDFFDWESRLLSIGPSISWQILSGGRIRANVALQTATQQELLAAYQAAVLQAFQDVEDALVAFSHEQATRAQLEDAVRANQRAADLARQAVRPGTHRLPHRARRRAIGLHLAGHARADRAGRRDPAGRALQGGRWWLGRRGDHSRGCQPRAMMSPGC
jgi:NodT family efflux transporter outer membrane factor (OMF) lipoprotein